MTKGANGSEFPHGAILSQGQVLVDNYRVESYLGGGGMGQVYGAEDIRLGIKVAIKVPSLEILGSTDGAQQFLTEAKVAARLGPHPHIVEIKASLVDPKVTISLGGDRGKVAVPFVVMEYLGGGDLRQRLSIKKQMNLQTAITCFEEMCSAVQHAHEFEYEEAGNKISGVVHRDLKPANIGFDSQNRLVVMDFGLAKLLRPARVGSLSGLKGTPPYMAPEQWNPQRGVDRRTDIYALGVILFEMLTGRLPFEGPSLEDLARQHLTQPPPDVRKFRKDVPQDVARAINKALQKDKDSRFRSAREFAEAVGGHEGGDKSKERARGTSELRARAKASPVLVALYLLALAVITVVLFLAGRDFAGGMRLVAGLLAGVLFIVTIVRAARKNPWKSWFVSGAASLAVMFVALAVTASSGPNRIPAAQPPTDTPIQTANSTGTPGSGIVPLSSTQTPAGPATRSPSPTSASGAGAVVASSTSTPTMKPQASTAAVAPTPTNTPTPLPSPTPTSVPTPTPTRTPTPTPTPTQTPTPTPRIVTGPALTYGDIVLGEIKPAGDVDVYNFQGKAGDIAMVSATETAGDSWYGLQIEVFDPQGKSLGKANAGLSQPVARTTTLLSTAGTYKILVHQPSARTGPYTLIIKNVGSAGGSPIAYGDVVEAGIQPQGDVDDYIFQGKAGDMAMVSATETAGDSWYGLQIEVFDPQGKSLGKANAGLSQPVARTTVQLTADGTYRILVQQPSARTGTYTLTIKNVA